MTEEEWGKLAYMIDNWWGQPPMDDDRAATYFAMLDGFAAADVELAVRDLVAEGLTFTPSLSLLLARVHGIGTDDSLRWPAAYRAMRAAIGAEDPARFLEPYHPLYLRFWHEHPELRTAATERQLASLEWAWKELREEWERGERRGLVLAGMERRRLVGGVEPKKLDGGAGMISAGEPATGEEKGV